MYEVDRENGMVEMADTQESCYDPIEWVSQTQSANIEQNTQMQSDIIHIYGTAKYGDKKRNMKYKNMRQEGKIRIQNR